MEFLSTLIWRDGLEGLFAAFGMALELSELQIGLKAEG